MSELLHTLKPIFNYIVFGVLTTLINVAVYFVCYEKMGITNLISTILAWIAAVAFAFVTNKMFVFNSRSWKRKLVIAEALKFFGCRIGTGAVEVGMMVLFVDMLHFSGTAMKLITNFVIIVLNFILSKLVIFRTRRSSHEI